MKYFCNKDLQPILKKFAPKLLDKNWIENSLAVSNIITFKATEHVINNLIDWSNVPNDPVFQLTFPQPDMLPDNILNKIKDLTKKTEGDSKQFKKGIFEIGKLLNPHQAAQHVNQPKLKTENGVKKIYGLQHKYRETCLYFYKPAQSCFANCTYCFRWPQLIGFEPFENENPNELFDYLAQKPMISDVLLTGGDVGTLHHDQLSKLLLPFVEGERVKELEHVTNLRIGTKGLTYWPNRYVDDPDSNDLLRLMEKVNNSGKQIQIMAHISHPNELEPEITKKAIKNLRNVGCMIRSQSPIVKHINDNSEAWARKWKTEVSLGIVPYYMFVERDTGPKAYFEIPLEKTLNIFNDAIVTVAGLARTVRGPSMSCTPGKVKICGIDEINGEKVFVLQFLQGRNPDWCKKLFYAKYDPKACWMDDLKPAFGEKKFFFEDELQEYLDEKKYW